MRYYIFIFAFLFSSLSYADSAIWLLIDTWEKTVDVRQGEISLEIFEHISLGRNGANQKQKLGDDVTPIGTYVITHTNNKSQFRKFFGINYPSVNDAEVAFFSGNISDAEYESIMQAHRNKRFPPQNTTLGGYIGIHGVGKGNEIIHGIFDWTHGCVALSNQQIDKLAKWIYKGMRVQIK